MIDLQKGDCLELMKSIPDGSVDMVLCDLPYGTTACKWDSVIPFLPLWEQYRRIIKSNGAIALFGSEPFSTMLRSSNIGQYKYDWIWLKNNSTGFVHAKNMPLKNHEIISVFSPGSIGHENLLGKKRMVYFPQGTVKAEKFNKSSKNKFGTIAGARPSQKDEFFTEAENYPKSVLKFNKEYGIHPSQKPVALLEYLIRTYTSPGETVLDNCMGSGSTGVACVNTGRNFIGMELDDHYFNVAQERIQKAVGR